MWLNLQREFIFSLSWKVCHKFNRTRSLLFWAIIMIHTLLGSFPVNRRPDATGAIHSVQWSYMNIESVKLVTCNYPHKALTDSSHTTHSSSTNTSGELTQLPIECWRQYALAISWPLRVLCPNTVICPAPHPTPWSMWTHISYGGPGTLCFYIKYPFFMKYPFSIRSIKTTLFFCNLQVTQIFYII